MPTDPQQAHSLGYRCAPDSTTGNSYVCPRVLGTFAVLSLMTGSAVEQLVPEPLGGNLSVTEREQLDAQRVEAAAALAFGSGALMVREDPGGSWGIPAGRPGELGQRKGWDAPAARRSWPEKSAKKPAHCSATGLLLPR